MSAIVLDTDKPCGCFRCERIIAGFEPKEIFGVVTQGGNQRLIVLCWKCVEELR